MNFHTQDSAEEKIEPDEKEVTKVKGKVFVDIISTLISRRLSKF